MQSSSLFLRKSKRWSFGVLVLFLLNVSYWSYHYLAYITRSRLPYAETEVDTRLSVVNPQSNPNHIGSEFSKSDSSVFFEKDNTFHYADETPYSGVNTDHVSILQFVERWRAAWAGRDMEGYFACYDTSFNPGKGMTLEQWQERRKALILEKKEISIEIVEPKLRIRDSGAMISFVLLYQSDNFRSRDTKLLELKRGLSGWRIVREETRSI